MIAVFAVLMVLSGLGGCFDRRELDTLGFVIGVGIDTAEKAGNTELTLQIANVSHTQSAKKNSKTSKDNESGNSPYLNISGTGETVNIILRELEHEISRQIYIPHLQILVFGEDLAKNGVRDSLDFFARAPEARMTQYVCVARGKASDIFEVETQLEQYPSTAIMERIREQDVTSDTPAVTEFEFVRTMMNKSTAAVAPIVEILKIDDTERLSVSGCAVFKDCVMVGELDKKESRGLLWVKDEVKNGVLSLNVRNEQAAVEIKESESKVIPEIVEDGTIHIRIIINENGTLGDQSGTVDLVAPENLPALLEETERAIREEIESAFEQSLQLKADIFGFGELIQKKYPVQWNDHMSDHWEDLYQQIQLDIEVNANIESTGRAVKPLIQE